MAEKFNGFESSLFTFLKQLEANNNRDWFNENKESYEEKVREPALAFIRAMAPKIESISPHFQAVDKKSGGSLIRVYRDTRFSKDKTPYKNNVGIHFKHEDGKNIQAPGFYLHLANDGNFFGVGLWAPETSVLTKIRQKIVDEPDRYKKILNAKKFGEFEQGGDRLKRPPKGFDKEHPLVEELKRKSFIASKKLTKKTVTSKDFVKTLTAEMKIAKPFVEFLCEAIDAPF